MLRSLVSTAKTISCIAITASRQNIQNACRPVLSSTVFQRNYSLLGLKDRSALLNNTTVAKNSLNPIQTRTLTKYSMRKGKRKSAKAVVGRFYRLNWGIWIRRIAGCHKKLWKKSPPRRRRLRQHVFCNATQSFLLDKMVGSYWRKPRYFVDNPYEPYHTREEFQFTYKKPRPYFPPEQ